MDQIVFLDRGTVKAPFRPPRFPHEWKEYATTSPAEVSARLAGATIVLINKVKLGPPELAAASTIKLIALTATGYDNVDVTYCRARGIAVCNAPGYARDSVPEHALMLMLALRRNLPGFQEALRQGRWQQSIIPTLLDFPVYDLQGATLGLMGYGELGRGVEKLAGAFGMRVLLAERKNSAVLRPGRETFEAVLHQSDIISLHLPLTPETRGLIGTPELALMKKGAILINTARGGVVDEAALAQALRCGHLGGAGVDVLSEEPPRSGNPLLEPGLPNLIVTPHIAWMSAGALARLTEQVIDNLESFNKGQPKNLVR